MAKKKDPFTINCINHTTDLAVSMQKAREKAGYTQKSFAELIGVSESCVQKCEQNANKIPAYMVYLYCQKLEIPIDEMYEKIVDGDSMDLVKQIEKKLPYLSKDKLKAIITMIG